MTLHAELRGKIIAAYGSGAELSEFEALVSEAAKHQLLEMSILKKAEMLRRGIWDLSDEVGAAGEIHHAITEFWIEMEGEAKAREALEERMASN